MSTGVDAPEIRNIVLLRPVESMVEFKQIVGRGTRLFDGKAYFTVYDFTKAHHHFQDPEWDGPPQAPEPPGGGGTGPRTCGICHQKPCICEKPLLGPCPKCENNPCVCETPPQRMVKVKLSESKALEIDSTLKTTFWSPEGKPISSAEFVQQLFKDLPSLFKDEEALRAIWVKPSTRKKLMEELEEKGYTDEQLTDLRELIHGENSDLYDVLIHVAEQKTLVPRSARAERAKIQLGDYNPQQQQFLNFVLEQYVSEGVRELNDEKLSSLLSLKYNALADAKQELGEIKSIRELFIDFQAYLYTDKVI